jgi:hypothetical protein
MPIGFWWDSQKERNQLDDLDIGGRMILRRILENKNGVLWTGLIWLWIGTMGSLL